MTPFTSTLNGIIGRLGDVATSALLPAVWKRQQRHICRMKLLTTKCKGLCARPVITTNRAERETATGLLKPFSRAPFTPLHSQRELLHQFPINPDWVISNSDMGPVPKPGSKAGQHGYIQIGFTKVFCQSIGGIGPQVYHFAGPGFDTVFGQISRANILFDDDFGSKGQLDRRGFVGHSILLIPCLQASIVRWLESQLITKGNCPVLLAGAK